jgi:hypothetical protein
MRLRQRIDRDEVVKTIVSSTMDVKPDTLERLIAEDVDLCGLISSWLDDHYAYGIFIGNWLRAHDISPFLDASDEDLVRYFLTVLREKRPDLYAVVAYNHNGVEWVKKNIPKLKELLNSLAGR